MTIFSLDHTDLDGNCNVGTCRMHIAP